MEDFESGDGSTPRDARVASAPAPDAASGPNVASTSAGARYSAWADRLREKRQRDQAHVRGVDAADPRPSPLERSHRHRSAGPARGGRPVLAPAPGEADRQLGVLGLEPGASAEEVNLAYRRLAKVHHPDRWAEADAATRRHHSEEMLRVNAAYRALRTSQIV